MLHDPDRVLDRIGSEDPALKLLSSLDGDAAPYVRLTLHEYRTVPSLRTHLSPLTAEGSALEGALPLPFEAVASSPPGTIFWTENGSGLVDAAIARQCGLFTVEWDGFDCLAELDGMAATTPPAWRLDAYVALRFHAIPADSLFFSARQEFQRRTGASLFRQVLSSICREQPELVMTLPVALRQ